LLGTHLNKYSVKFKQRIPVEITDTHTKITSRYESIVETAAALNTNEKYVKYAEKANKLLLKRYIEKYYEILRIS